MNNAQDIYRRFEPFYAGFLELKINSFDTELHGNELNGDDQQADINIQQHTNHSVNIDSIQRECIQLIKQNFSADYFSKELTETIMYTLCCFIDDEMIRTNWSGKDQWEKQTLESITFHTSKGGEEIFKNINELITNGGNRNISKQISQIYLLILALGFRGKYIFEPDFSLRNLKKQLFSIINEDLAKTTRIVDKPIMAQPYQYTEVLNQFERLPTLRYWINLIGAIFIFYFVISYGAWIGLTFDLNNEMVDLQKALAKASNLWGES